MSEKILLVDDETTILEFVTINLERSGFQVITATDGEEALEIAREEEPQLILLDIMLPGRDGLEVLKELRRHHSVPIIMLTARGDDIDRILGLEMGADDYVTKPFNPRELVARIKAILRRSDAADSHRFGGSLRRGDMLLDRERHQLQIKGKSVALTPKEFELLELFMTQPGRVFSRENLLRKVWGYDYFGDSKTVDVHVRRLREKIEKEPGNPYYLLTVWGVGYKFREENDA